MQERSLMHHLRSACPQFGEEEPSHRLHGRWHLLPLSHHKGPFLVPCEAFPSDKWCSPVSSYPSEPLNEFDCTLKMHPCHRSELTPRGKISFPLIHIIFFHLSHYLLSFKIPNARAIRYWLLTNFCHLSMHLYKAWKMQDKIRPSTDLLYPTP